MYLSFFLTTYVSFIIRTYVVGYQFRKAKITFIIMLCLLCVGNLGDFFTFIIIIPEACAQKF